MALPHHRDPRVIDRITGYPLVALPHLIDDPDVPQAALSGIWHGWAPQA